MKKEFLLAIAMVLVIGGAFALITVGDIDVKTVDSSAPAPVAPTPATTSPVVPADPETVFQALALIDSKIPSELFK